MELLPLDTGRHAVYLGLRMIQQLNDAMWCNSVVDILNSADSHCFCFVTSRADVVI